MEVGKTRVAREDRPALKEVASMGCAMVNGRRDARSGDDDDDSTRKRDVISDGMTLQATKSRKHMVVGVDLMGLHSEKWASWHPSRDEVSKRATASTALSRSRLMVNEDIPEDIICNNIFTRLPFKLVMSLKTMSRYYNTELRSNTNLGAMQALLCPSCPALIHIGPSNPESSMYSIDVLSTTSTIVGVPSLGLDFLGCRIDNGHFDLLASSNGLLCIRYTSYRKGPLTQPPIILIANPATQQAQPIPGAPQHIGNNKVVGLVFNPINPLDDPLAKQKFMIVLALPFPDTNDTTKFYAVTFSSDTGRWAMSDSLIHANIKQVWCNKVVYASGVLYWDYQEDLLWFDVAGTVTGSIKMPWKLQCSNFEGCKRHSIDVSNNDMLMCTTIDEDGLAMYQLVTIGGHYWELKHKKGWKDIMEISVDAFQFCHSMKLRNGWQAKFYERWCVRPLGLESGRWVYFAVTLNYKTSDNVLCYDIDTGKVHNTGMELCSNFGIYYVFGYHNSMAPLPPIEVPISQDGICDGKSHGCICVKNSF